MTVIDEVLAKKIIQPRPLDSHKGTFGRILLIGGTYPYGGAIIMAALACVNSGAGLVTVATDRDNIGALHSHLPEAMAFDLWDQALLVSQIKVSDTILIGPGLAEDDAAQKIFKLVLASLVQDQILIVDGSALNLLARQEAVSWQTNRLILTPHQKEWERLSGLSIPEQTQEATQVALRHFPQGTILVAKSPQTKVYQGQRVGQILVGGPYQATGGMGDTLAGMIAGLSMQFKERPLLDRVSLAVYLHSAIAQDLSQSHYVVLPTMISQEIPRLMKALSDSSSDG